MYGGETVETDAADADAAAAAAAEEADGPRALLLQCRYVATASRPPRAGVSGAEPSRAATRQCQRQRQRFRLGRRVGRPTCVVSRWPPARAPAAASPADALGAPTLAATSAPATQRPSHARRSRPREPRDVMKPRRARAAAPATAPASAPPPLPRLLLSALLLTDELKAALNTTKNKVTYTEIINMELIISSNQCMPELLQIY
ncbi:Protein of unknown function [Gryllus bimaculatus]|nr:Protein of unknown function [Gryllus bimaculatus]